MAIKHKKVSKKLTMKIIDRNWAKLNQAMINAATSIEALELEYPEVKKKINSGMKRMKKAFLDIASTIK
jgi:hypothetical protein